MWFLLNRDREGAATNVAPDDRDIPQSILTVFVKPESGARALTGLLYGGLSVGPAADLLVGADH